MLAQIGVLRTGGRWIGAASQRAGLRNCMRDGAARVHLLLVQSHAHTVLPQVGRRQGHLQLPIHAMLRSQSKPSGAALLTAAELQPCCMQLQSSARAYMSLSCAWIPNFVFAFMPCFCLECAKQCMAMPYLAHRGRKHRSAKAFRCQLACVNITDAHHLRGCMCRCRNSPAARGRLTFGRPRPGRAARPRPAQQHLRRSQNSLGRLLPRPHLYSHLPPPHPRRQGSGAIPSSASLAVAASTIS